MKTFVRIDKIMAIMTILVVVSLISTISLTGSVTAEAASFSRYTYYVVSTPAGVNVRYGPGTNYKKSGDAIPGGTVVRSTSSENGWLFICEPCTGWVSREYCKKCENFIDHNNEIRHGVVVSTNGSNLNLRSGPSESFRIVAKIPNGTYLSPSFKYNGWCRVLYKGKIGWISMKYTRNKYY